MSSVEQLPLALLLDDRGHLSELGASVVADGESALLPDELRDHLAACPTCAGLLGEAALLSLTAREVVRDARPASVATPSLPWGWIAPALALACASALPSAALSLAQGKSAFLSTLRLFLRGVRALAFALAHAAETGAWAPLALSSAFVLVLAGIALGFVASRRSLSQGDFS